VYELTLGTPAAQFGLSGGELPKPVFAGDTIRVESEVVEAHAPKSRPRAGTVVFEHRPATSATTSCAERAVRPDAPGSRDGGDASTRYPRPARTAGRVRVSRKAKETA
jgi:hypothetical protein